MENVLRPLDLSSLESLRDQPPDDLVLFTSSHHLAKYVPFRQFCGHTEWPICGLTHGLSANTLIPSYSWNYFSAIKSYDAIVCTSSSGKTRSAQYLRRPRKEQVRRRRARLLPTAHAVDPSRHRDETHWSLMARSGA